MGPLGRPKKGLLRGFVVACLSRMFESKPRAAKPSERVRDFIADDRFATRAFHVLRAVQDLKPGDFREVMAAEVPLLVGGCSDDRLMRVVGLADAIPDTVDWMDEAQRNRLKQYVENLPSDELLAALRSAPIYSAGSTGSVTNTRPTRRRWWQRSARSTKTSRVRPGVRDASPRTSSRSVVRRAR